MTKEEIIAAIKQFIEGQGNQVDLGGKLSEILNGILSLIIDGGATIAEVDSFENFDEGTLYSAGDIVRYQGKLYSFNSNKGAGPWDGTKVSVTNIFDILYELIERITPVAPTVTISALESADMTAEEASAAGFTPEVIAALQAADNPTVHFSDMCVTFNAVEVISDDLVNQSALVVHTAVGGGTLHKCILSLYTDGRIVYTVTDID